MQPDAANDLFINPRQPQARAFTEILLFEGEAVVARDYTNGLIVFADDPESIVSFVQCGTVEDHSSG